MRRSLASSPDSDLRSALALAFNSALAAGVQVRGLGDPTPELVPGGVAVQPAVAVRTEHGRETVRREVAGLPGQFLGLAAQQHQVFAVEEDRADRAAVQFTRLVAPGQHDLVIVDGDRQRFLPGQDAEHQAADEPHRDRADHPPWLRNRRDQLEGAPHRRPGKRHHPGRGKFDRDHHDGTDQRESQPDENPHRERIDNRLPARRLFPRQHPQNSPWRTK